MTQKHFVIVARTIANMHLSKRNRLLVANALAREFKEINPRFKHEVFINACCPK